MVDLNEMTGGEFNKGSPYKDIKQGIRTSPVVHWFRICLPMQGT